MLEGDNYCHTKKTITVFVPHSEQEYEHLVVLLDSLIGLMHSDRETGFLPSLCIVTKYSRKNPVSGFLFVRKVKQSVSQCDLSG